MRSLLVVGLAGTLALGTLAALGCGRDKGKVDGLPAGDQWGAGSDGVAPLTKDTPVPSMGGGGTMGSMGGNPHAGAGGAAGGNPHAGMDMGQGQGADPHAGLGIDVGQGANGGGVDVAALGLPVPDPNRQIDPTRYIKGVISLGDKAKGKAKANTPIFVVVRKLDATGAPTGSPLAVDKLEWVDGEVVYELTEAKAMVGGTELTGDVIITARIDQDGDAISKQPGDITGSAHAKLPADNVRIVLDTVL